MQESDLQESLIEAALDHVVFDGWSEATLKAAAQDCNVPLSSARQLFPRGGADLAAGYHRMLDRRMTGRLESADLGAMRFRDRVAYGVRLRLEIADREAVRRGASLFALPLHAPEGARLVWGTADAIWTALGDRSEDYNWYTKRLTLSGVYSATALFWLGDTSEGAERTWEFLSRRIDGVMQFEKTKARVRDSSFGKAFAAGPGRLLERIRPPRTDWRKDMPGSTQ